jgi:hypothetical protein
MGINYKMPSNYLSDIYFIGEKYDNQWCGNYKEL